MRRDFLSRPEGLACHREIRRRLGQALQASYEPTLSERLPEQLADLLQRLAERERDQPARARRSVHRFSE
jgi:hypothetical protein